MDHFQPKSLLLIADAESENVRALKAILAPEHDILVAADGEAAIRLAASEERPAIILLSVMMPVGDAFDVCRRLKADRATADIPIILISEQTLEDTEAKGLACGAADYITRPFKKSVVLARIRTHLELKRCRENLEKRLTGRVNALHEEIRERRDVDDTYRSLVEHAKDGIVIVHDFKVQYANPAFAEMIGFPTEELIGAHLRKFISEAEFVKNTKRYSERIAGLNLPRIYKSKVIHSNGTTIDVELNVCVVPYGRSLAALVFVRDIREEEDWQYCI